MDELNFTWKTALKLFAGLLLLGVWLMARQQSKLDQSEHKAQTDAKANGAPLPGRRITSQKSLAIVALAIVFLIASLLWGNDSTI